MGHPRQRGSDRAGEHDDEVGRAQPQRDGGDRERGDAGALAFVGPRMLAEASGLAGAHVVSVAGDVATLSAAWTGSSGTATVLFRNDHRNYAVQFQLAL